MLVNFRGENEEKLQKMRIIANKGKLKIENITFDSMSGCKFFLLIALGGITD